MNAQLLNEVRRGFYLDSVALMRLSRRIAGLPGIIEAALMMGTPSNKEILREAGLLGTSGEVAEGNDLIIGVRAESAAAGEAALREALDELERPRRAAGEAEAWRPRSLRAAHAALEGANLALISVAGDFAAAEARKALRRGLHVMIFSDNVPLAEERALKEEARECGRLVMGPDCGTAIINGVPLAFANRLPRGDIGIIGASGTGLQEVSCLIAGAGGGISQGLGVGGRDLKGEIGGITTLMAIEALDADPATRRVVLISKPPDPEVARAVLARIGESPKPFVVCFIGARDLKVPSNAVFAPTLKAAAEAALEGAAIGADFARPDERRGGGRGVVAGLFTGGTLAAEAQVLLAAAGRALASNAPIPGVAPLAEAPAGADRIIDLGSDEYTRGRPHPMIDPAVRDEALAQALRDPEVAVVLLDLVIGYGAHEDPAGHLADQLAALGGNGPPLVASVTGTEQDPQVRSRQVARLAEAGVRLAPSNAQATELALSLAQRGA